MVRNIPLPVLYYFFYHKLGKELFYYVSLFEKAEGGYLRKSTAKNLLNTINKDKRTINKRIEALIELGLLSEDKNKYKLTSIVKVAEAIEGTQPSYPAIPYYYGFARNFDEFKQLIITAEVKINLTQKSKEASKKYQLLKAKNIEITEKNDPRLYSDSQGNKTSFMRTSDQGFDPLRSQAKRLNLSHVEVHNQRKKAVDGFLMEDQSYYCPEFDLKRVESILDCLAFGNTQRNPEKYHPQRFVLNEQGYYSMRMEKLLTIKNFKPTKCYLSKSCRRKLKESSVTSLSNVVKCGDAGAAVVGELNYITQPRSFSGGGVTNKRLNASATPTLRLYSPTTTRKAKLSSTFLESIGAEPIPKLLSTQYGSYFHPENDVTINLSLTNCLKQLSLLNNKSNFLSQTIVRNALPFLLKLNSKHKGLKSRYNFEINLLKPNSKVKPKEGYCFSTILQWEFNSILYSLNSKGIVTQSEIRSN